MKITSPSKSSGIMFAAFTSVILLSSVFVGVAYGAVSLDKGTYTWTDKVHIRVTEHGLDLDGTSVRISTSDHQLNNYKLSKAGNGLYVGEIILTGFLHDVDGDGRPDTNPRTREPARTTVFWNPEVMMS